MHLSLPNGLNFKYGILDDLKFATIGDAFRSLYSQLPDLHKEMKDKFYLVKINGKPITSELMLDTPLQADDVVELVDDIVGSGGGGKLIIGAMLAVVGAVLVFTGIGAALGGTLIKAGLGLALAGAAAMFAATPASNEGENGENRLFQGQVAGSSEGSWLGLIVGNARVTGEVIDQEIKIGNKQKNEYEYYWDAQEPTSISFAVDIETSIAQDANNGFRFGTRYTATPVPVKYQTDDLSYDSYTTGQMFTGAVSSYSASFTHFNNEDEKEVVSGTINTQTSQFSGTKTIYIRKARYLYTHNIGEAFNVYNVTFALGCGRIAGVNAVVTENGVIFDDVRKHIFFDDTPIMESGGDTNYKISTAWRNGYKEQSIIEQAGYLEETYDANIELAQYDMTAHTVDDADVDVAG